MTRGAVASENGARWASGRQNSSPSLTPWVWVIDSARCR